MSGPGLRIPGPGAPISFTALVKVFEHRAADVDAAEAVLRVHYRHRQIALMLSYLFELSDDVGAQHHMIVEVTHPNIAGVDSPCCDIRRVEFDAVRAIAALIAVKSLGAVVPDRRFGLGGNVLSGDDRGVLSLLGGLLDLDTSRVQLEPHNGLGELAEGLLVRRQGELRERQGLGLANPLDSLDDRAVLERHTVELSAVLRLDPVTTDSGPFDERHLVTTEVELVALAELADHDALELFGELLVVVIDELDDVEVGLLRHGEEEGLVGGGHDPELDDVEALARVSGVRQDPAVAEPLDLDEVPLHDAPAVDGADLACHLVVPLGVEVWRRSGDDDIRLTDRCNPSTALRQGQHSGA